MKLTQKTVNKILTFGGGILIIFVLLYIINIFLEKKIERFDIDNPFYNSTTKICNLTNQMTKKVGYQSSSKNVCGPKYTSTNNKYYDKPNKICYSLYDYPNKQLGIIINDPQLCPMVFNQHPYYDYTAGICKSIYNNVRKEFGYPIDVNRCPITIQPQENINICPPIPNYPVQTYPNNGYNDCLKLCPDNTTVLQNLDYCHAACIS